MSQSETRVGFIISHPFQYKFYKSIALKYRNPVFILETRHSTPFEFSDQFLSSLHGQVLRIPEGQLITLDGLLDVVFCMTPKHVLTLFKATKTVALQYSLAKEVYQYGAWRAVADLNIMHGSYSWGKVDGFCVSAIGGNPRFDDEIRATQGGGILYMPTYGELSSLKVFNDALPSIPTDIDIKVKLHHASEFEDVHTVEMLRSNPRVTLIDGYSDALPEIACADLVISDYSGAIFDALYLGKPIGLIQHPITQSKIRTDALSLEIARAGEIGPIARGSADVCGMVEAALAGGDSWETSRRELKAELFSFQGESTTEIVALVNRLLEGGFKQTLVQSSIRTTLSHHIAQNRELRQKLGKRKKREKGVWSRRPLMKVYHAVKRMVSL